MKEELSPEERLLKLIRQGKSTKGPSDVDNRAESSKVRPVPKLVKKLRSAANGLIKKPRILIVQMPGRVKKAFVYRKKRILRYGLLKFINRVLVGLLILTLSYLLIDSILVGLLSKWWLKQLMSGEARPGLQRPEELPAVQPYAYYLEEIAGRDVFRPLVRKQKRQVSGTTAKSPINDLMLVGVIAGEKPQAIIEDKKLKKTYFLYAGEFIGDIQVDSVSKDKVILNYQDELFELVL